MKALNLSQVLEITGGDANQESQVIVKEVSALVDASEFSLSFLFCTLLNTKEAIFHLITQYF